MSTQVAVSTRHVPERGRVEATTEDGRVAGFAQYVEREGRLVFFHTEVDGAFEGHGVGSTIAAAVMELARSTGQKIEPQCPFIRAYMTKHPETADLLAKGSSRTGQHTR